MRATWLLLGALSLPGCTSLQNLTPAQQALLTDLEALGVRAACQKIETQYAKVGRPTPLQESLMGAVRVKCMDPYAAASEIKARAADLIAALPV